MNVIASTVTETKLAEKPAEKAFVETKKEHCTKEMVTFRLFFKIRFFPQYITTLFILSSGFLGFLVRFFFNLGIL